jgi:hypothetical protein
MCQLEPVTTRCFSHRRAIPFIRRTAWIIGSFALIACGLFSAHAQYPNVSKAIAAEARARQTAAAQRSDEAFARALPVIKQWEAKGKPLSCRRGRAQGPAAG